MISQATSQDEIDVKGVAALPFVVVRITAGVMGNSGKTAVGTGLLYRFNIDGLDIPCVVSNKHVIADRPWLSLGFAEKIGGRRALQPAYELRVDHGQLPVICHPDPRIDLAIMPVGPIWSQMSADGRDPFLLLLSKDNHLPAEMVESLAVATDVLMVGFPTGLVDEHNNLPVTRRGSLATPYRADFRGQPNFVVDIAAFGGSSGSPVFAFFNGFAPTAGGFRLGGQSFYLIGVLHSGPFVDAVGQVVDKPIPTEHVSVTRQMIHLGYCAKVHLLDDFIPLLRAMK